MSQNRDKRRKPSPIRQIPVDDQLKVLETKPRAKKRAPPIIGSDSDDESPLKSKIETKVIHKSSPISDPRPNFLRETPRRREKEENGNMQLTTKSKTVDFKLKSSSPLMRNDVKNNTQDTEGIKRKKNRFSSNCKLVFSTPCSIDFFYKAPFVQPVIGQLMARVNDEEMKNVFVSRRSSMRLPFTPFSPKGTIPDSALSPLKKENLLNTVLIKESESDSSDCNSLDASFVETRMQTKFIDKITPSKNEIKLIFKDSIIFIKQYDQENFPPIIEMKLNKSDLDKPKKVINHILDEMEECFPPLVEGHLRQKKELKLTEKETNSIASTDLPFIITWKRVSDKLFSKNKHVKEPKKKYNDFNLTTLFEVATNDITTYDRNGTVFLDSINPDAFAALKLGRYITDPTIDILHIFAFHNLGINIISITKEINQIAEDLANNSESLSQMYAMLQYILSWIFLFPNDFKLMELVSEMNSILDKIYQKGKELNNEQIQKSSKILKTMVRELYNEERTPHDYFWKLVPPKISYESSKPIKIIQCKGDVSTLVAHLTYIELAYINRIQRNELLRSNWTKENSKTTAPNVVALLQRFEDTANFIVSSIMVENSTRRARKLLYWIEAMKEAKEQNNFMLLFEIDAALFSMPVIRMTSTWKHIPTEDIQVLNHLHHICSPSHNYVLRYKSMIFKDPTITIPYIGILLNELQYNFENSQITKQMMRGKEFYNMSFQRSYMKTVEQILQPWGTSLSFHLDGQLLKECEKLEGKSETLAELFSLSTSLERPRSTEPGFIQNIMNLKQKK